MTTRAFTPWNHEAVLRAFGELTGIVFRVVGEEQRRHAQRFADAFTLRELELVVLWTKRQIAAQAGGFNGQSLTWRVLMGSAYGDEFVRFQERLGLAQEAVKRRAFTPRYVLSESPATPPRLPAKPAATAPQDADAIRRHTQQGLGDLLKQMQGRPAIDPQMTQMSADHRSPNDICGNLRASADKP